MSSKASIFLTLALFLTNVKTIAADSNKKSTANNSPVLNTNRISEGSITSPLNSITLAKPLEKPQVSVKGYKEWKTEKIREALKKVASVKSAIDQKKASKLGSRKTEAGLGKDLEIDKLENQLKNDLFSLEIVQQLNVEDYFAIYLTKLDNKDEAFKKVAQKMSPEEVAELIGAFSNSFLNSQRALISPSATNDSFEDRIK